MSEFLNYEIYVMGIIVKLRDGRCLVMYLLNKDDIHSYHHGDKCNRHKYRSSEEFDELGMIDVGV